MKFYPCCVLLLALNIMAEPVSPLQLESELNTLEQTYLSDRELGLRVQRLKRDLSAYTSAQQTRITRLACRLQSANETAEYRQAMFYADEQLQRATAQGDQFARSDFFMCRGWFHQLLGENDKASQDYDLALTLARDIGSLKQQASALSYRGSLFSFLGHPAKGLRDLMNALHIYDALDLPGWYGKVQLEIAATYRRMGLMGPANRLLDELEMKLPANSDPDIFYEFYRQKAMVANSMGQYQEAIDELDNAAAQHNELTPVEKGLLQLDRAEALLGLDNYQEAIVQLEQAGIVFQSEIDPLFNSYWHLLMAQKESMTGKYGHALEHLAMAEPTLVREDNQRFLIKLTWLRSQAFEGLGKTADALAQLHRYVELKRAFEQEMQEQSTEWVRSQFELARQEGENKQLRVEQLLQQQELALAKERRFWLLVVMVLCGVLALLTMGWLLDRNRRMRRLAFTDELTGINNRRRVLRQGSDMLALARRQGTPFCLLVFDIDHFKRINDTLGHHQGDRVLQWVSRAADRQLRHQDQLGRTGGEEFLILLPDTSLEEACRVAERIRHTVANRALPGMSYPVTISIGCASLRDDDQDLVALIQRADNALYRAKEAGRNRVETDE